MGSRAAYDYDVVLMSDLRYPGGNSASLAEEVTAQSQAGYRTALMHLPAPHMTRRRAFNRRIARCLSAGLADLVPADSRLRARAFIIRQPRLFTAPPGIRLRVDADVRLLIANQPPVDGLKTAEDPYYDVQDVRDRAERLLGEVRWCPIGPLVRQALLQSGVALPLSDEDWVNILDVRGWHVPRSGPQDERPRIGRHSRAHPAKWPADAREVLAAYPDDPGVDVRILGGAEPALALLGRQPRNWTVHPFGSMPPQRFLRDIDVFVYYHHPDWVEAFGRNIIEGLASGCPAILPPHFEPLFRDACQYSPAAGSRALVEALHEDPAGYREWSARGTEFVETTFGFTTHLRRLAELIGPPSGSAQPPPPPRARRRVLCASSALGGIGSLTRLLRAASALDDDVEAVLLVAVPAVAQVLAAGHLCEVIPPAIARDESQAGRRIAEAAARHEAECVLLDAPAATPALLAALGETGLPVVRTDPEAPGSVAPGDLLGQPPAPEQPALLPARSAPLEPAPAPGGAGGRRALLAPGADEAVISAPRVQAVAEALVERGWSVTFAEPVLPTGETELPDGVERRRLAPLAGHLASFDLVVADPGPTTVAELAAARACALLLPLRRGREAEPRAAVAEQRGLAALDRFDPARLEAVLDELDRPERRHAVSRAWPPLPPDARPSVAGGVAAALGREAAR